MAGKVNYRFVAALCAILIACTLGVVGLWYLFVRTDPAETIARADGAFEQKQYPRASSLYGKALGKRPNDIALIMKFANSIKPIEVSDVRTARDAVQQLQAAYRNALQVDPLHPQAFEDLMELTMRIGRDLGDFDAWNQMVITATSSLAVDDTFALAHKYRGIAQVNLMEVIDTSPESRDRARADLQAAAKAFPKDVQIAYHRVRWHLNQSRKLARSGNQLGEVSRHHLRAMELSKELLNTDPEDPQRRLYHIRVLTALEKHDQAVALFTKLESQLLKRAKPADVVLAVANRIALIASKPDTAAQSSLGQDGLNRVEALLRAAIARHPGDLRFNTALGRTLTLQGRYDQAMQILQQVMEKPLVTTPVNLLRDANLQKRALAQHADLILTRAKTLPPDEKQLALKQVDQVVRKLQSATGQSALVSLMEGKLHMVREQWPQALSKLDRASDMFKDQNPEALLYAATACIKLNEPGASIDRLEKLIELRSNYMPARYELMRLHLKLSQYGRLSSQIQATLSIAPNDFEAQQYRARMLARRGRIREAILAFDALDINNHPSLVIWLSKLYLATNQEQRALGILQKSFTAAPTDPNILLQLLNQTQDKNIAGKYIQQAQQAGLSDKVVKLLKQKIAGELDSNRIASIEKLINEEQDPFKRHTNRYRLYTGLGLTDQANTELNQLATLKPNDPLVVEAQFEQAIKQHNWDVAEQLTRQAVANDLDLAQGSFFQGRLELARGQPELAMVSLEQGLGQRSVYSRGWRDLGDAQRASGDMALAATSYRKSLDQNPNNVDAVRGLVAALDAQGHHEQALQELREMTLRGPQNAKLLDVYLAYEQQHGDARRAMEIRKRLAEKNPDDANNQRALAVMFAQQQKPQDAKRLIDNLIAREGNTRQNLYIKATVMSLAGQSTKAQQLLEDHVQGLGKQAQEEDWIILARFLMRAGETDHAIQAYRKGIEVENAAMQNASRELADQLFALGQYDPAAALYGKMNQSDPKDQRIGYRYVEALIRSDQLSNASTVLHQIVRDYQPTAGAYLLASVIARQQKDLAKAMEALDSAAQLEPNRAMVYFERAQLRLTINPKDPQVRDDLQQAITLDPELSPARRQLTALLLDQDDRVGAIHELTALKQRNPNDPTLRAQLAELYYADRQLMQLHALLDDSIKRFPNDAIWPRMQGRLAKIENQTDLAVRNFQLAFTLSPTAPVLTELLDQLLEAGHVQEALSLLREHEQLIKNDPHVGALRGRALAISGHTGEAQIVLADAVKQCSNFKDVLNTSSQLILALGRERGVIELEALSASNDKLRPWVQMALAQSDIEHHVYGKAVSRLHAIEQAAADLSDGRVEYMRLLALALHKQGDYPAAIAQYRLVLDNDADNIGALNNFAFLLAENLNRAEEALEPATHAAQLAPQNAQILDTLGWVQHLAGKQNNALNTLKRSVHLKPLANNCYHLAVVLHHSGDFAQAKEMLMTAQSLAQKQGDDELLALIRKGLNH